MKTGRYEKSGPDVLQLFENGKIADIIFAYQTGKDAELINDFHRLISQYKNDVHFTGGWNAEYLLKKKVGVESTFKFLCDFNSDGKVDGGKEAKDVGAVMGIQLYENLLDAGTVKYDEDKKEYILVDGEETSNMIEHILLSVASSTTINDKLKTAIDFFLSSKKKELTYTVKDETGEKPKTRKEKMEINTGRDASGNISIENFLSFMKGEFVYKENVNEDEQKAIDEKLKTTAGYDIKEYLRVNGDKLNAKRDMAEIFLDPEEIANRTREASRDFYEATENIKDSYRRVIANEQIEKSNVDRGRMKNGLEKFADSDIAAAKNSIVDKMAIVAMTITDHIFFNLGDNTEAWINMFG